ncbi:hypothetical protein GCM10010383_16320 [Streptomyces lomondensis]|uniref:Uncharacterized protein n=1 Tax=Streptomyces lomondensis TaxID=68229 RepID=A0ABQ2WZW1_9ACTN|nr:hypothetical protein GCM10010383_16320 [Streptomyces lomondensis]
MTQTYGEQQGKQSGKRSHWPHSEFSGRYRSDRIAGYRGSGPDHGKTRTDHRGPRTEDIARSFRCSMT